MLLSLWHCRAHNRENENNLLALIRSKRAMPRQSTYQKYLHSINRIQSIAVAEVVQKIFGTLGKL